MAYFFEAGHASAPEAHKIIHVMFSRSDIKQQFRYVGHAFVEKEKSPAIQAADLLAWQWYTDRRHELEGRPRRKDCDSLLKAHHTVVHIEGKELDRMADETIMIADLFGKQSSAKRSF
jgi:hypothetical protein